MENRTKTSSIIWIVPAAMCILALMPLPYGYYTLLRIVVTTAAIYAAWLCFSEGEAVDLRVAGFVFIAILFNPIIPIHLSREIWAPIDVVAAAAFGVFGWRQAQKQ